jgi:hypothetical protein
MPEAQRPLMRGYGVPEDPEGTLPWSWAEERLIESRNYWVVTVDPDGAPHAMPVWGLWRRGEDQFWFSSAPDSMKARNIAENPNVVVTADSTVEVVSVEGVATQAEKRRNIADEYAAKYESDPDARSQLAEFFLQGGIFRVTPTRAFGIIERPEEFSERATRWVW